jgi:hypothetical protein
MMGLRSSRLYPSVPLWLAQPDVEQSIAMQVGDLMARQHELGASETMGPQSHFRKLTQVRLDLIHGHQAGSAPQGGYH